jgi:hypothetical protein
MPPRERRLHAQNAVSEASDVRLILTLKLRGKPYQLTVTTESFRLASKRARREIVLPWTAFLDEDAAMLSALHASIRERLRGRG